VGLTGAGQSPQSSHKTARNTKMAALKRKAQEDTVSPPPYIDLALSSDEEDEDDNQPGSWIFPHDQNYPTFLLPRDEVRPRNGFVWLPSDRTRRRNIEKCTYIRPLPSRGNCVMCGRSGPLGQHCSNGCVYDRVSVDNIKELDTVPERSDVFEEDADLHIQMGAPVQYRLISTPKHNNVIDAVYFAELMYNGVDKEEDHYDEWIKRSNRFRMRKHDKIRANEERWSDPWVFQFQLDKDCNWWQQFEWLSKMEGLDAENPTPDMKKRYKQETKRRRRS